MKWLPDSSYFQNNVAFRNDTLLGVCEALGTDLGFNPNFLRVPLAAGIVFAPVLILGIYFTLGALAFVSRTFFPDRTQAVPVRASERQAEIANEDVDLPRAA